MFELVANNVWARTSAQGNREQREKWRAVVGGKALGLAALPSKWTPPFLILSTTTYREWASAPDTSKDAIVGAAAADLNSLIPRHFATTDHGLIIRSSAVNESMSQRGAYQSHELPADFDESVIAETIRQIFSGFLQSDAHDELALVVQVRIHLQIRGHLSNERRVSKTENHWAWEVELPEYEAGRFNSQRASPPNILSGLHVGGSGSKGLLNVFRKIGRWSTELQEGRVHLEWGQSSDSLWLFQLDFEDEQPDEGVDPNSLLRDSDSLPTGLLPRNSPVHVADFQRSAGWSKIDKVKVFLTDQSRPYPRLFYLTGAEFEKARSAGHNLQGDITEAVGHRLVCRTDCAAAGIDRLNLPRTDSVSAERAVSFMSETLISLSAKGAKPNEICFIFHRFIPASVAAWALAKPDTQLVLVDALWGLPDGLQFLPHDTFEFDVKREAISAEYIRYKPKFLQETESGEWKLVNVARSIARHRSLLATDLREVAVRTHDIATRLGRAVQIMWFCAVPESADIGRNIPWFMMDPEPTTGLPRKAIAPDKRRFQITSFRDLDTARLQPNGRIVLSLEPGSELFRSSEFLDSVADIALAKNFPVAMTGSLLAHAYYTLERKGVSVVTDASGRTRVRQRQIFRKLVRDEIPAKITEHGERANLAHIAKSESRTALVIKLFEEAQELLKANNPKDVTTELADLLEVVRALSAATGVDWTEVQAVAEAKRELRGSFDRNVVLMETSWPRWSDTMKVGDQQMIPLKDLGEVTGSLGDYIVNFTAAVAKNADNVVDLGNNVRVSVSIVDGGIRILCIGEPHETDDTQQLAFGF